LKPWDHAEVAEIPCSKGVAGIQSRDPDQQIGGRFDEPLPIHVGVNLGGRNSVSEYSAESDVSNTLFPFRRNEHAGVGD